MAIARPVAPDRRIAPDPVLDPLRRPTAGDPVPTVDGSLPPAFAPSASAPSVVAPSVVAPSAPPVFDTAPLARLSPDDRLLFQRFGAGQRVTPGHGCIHHAIAEQVTRHPDAVAARHLDPRRPVSRDRQSEITYAELDRQAERLAGLLHRHGVRRGDRVALFLERSIPMLVGLLATLKAGAAYVPQHVGVAPQAQLRHVLAASGARVVLTLSHLRHLVPVPHGHVCLAVDEVMAEPLPAGSVKREPVATEPDDDCFVLFTSGTTGRPNGVRVTHRNVTNILLTEPGDLGMRPGRTVAQILSIAFDMAAWEILGCLSHGATLVIRGRDIEAAVRHADIVIATPSVLGALDPQRCRNVQVVAVAGEPCPRPLADAWAEFADFHNACGPTETTIVNTVTRHRPGAEQLTIGRPTPNNTVYVLDEQLRPVPIGEVGEMWAGGDGVSAGYLDDPELTAERYRPDPFLGGDRIMFRTRDLGRWTADGELEHLGRTDDQVKVRGFRVELDSVSALLESAPGVAQATTLKLDDRTLVAVVRPATADTDVARAAVADVLPYYAVPAVVVAVDEVPVTSRGKTDKRALLELARQRLAVDALLADALDVVAEAADAAAREPVVGLPRQRGTDRTDLGQAS